MSAALDVLVVGVEHHKRFDRRAIVRAVARVQTASAGLPAGEALAARRGTGAKEDLA